MVRKQVEVVVRPVLSNYASLCSPNIYCTGCLQKSASGSYLEVFVSLLSFTLFLYESANCRLIICQGLPDNIVYSLYDHSFVCIFHGCTMLGARSASKRKICSKKQSSVVTCKFHCRQAFYAWCTFLYARRKVQLLRKKILGAPYKFYIYKQMCLLPSQISLPICSRPLYSLVLTWSNLYTKLKYEHF